MRTIITALLLTASGVASAEDDDNSRVNQVEAFAGLALSGTGAGGAIGVEYWAAEEFSVGGELVVTQDSPELYHNPTVAAFMLGGTLNAPVKVNDKVTLDLVRFHLDLATMSDGDWSGTGIMYGGGWGIKSRSVMFSAKGTMGKLGGETVGRATFTIGAML